MNKKDDNIFKTIAQQKKSDKYTFKTIKQQCFSMEYYLKFGINQLRNCLNIGILLLTCLST